ncbi:hypothetical protein EV132_10718 [Rhizobium sullae]|uniref:DUF5983 domain-containing protein n=2 Tax=Rhizobium sullae TaxID=50338 RepID=A0A4R3Q374_RHISU|nr:hypothetical protein EV132_10718 [Rhizobium sullae]
MFPRVLMISTGHLSARTARFLRNHDAADWPCLGGHFGDVGFMLWVDEGASGMEPNLPRDISEVFEYASSQAASIVIFQDVSPIVLELPTYGDEDAFEADEFLDRPRKTVAKLEDEEGLVALETLAADGNAGPGDDLIEKMYEIMNVLAEYGRNKTLCSFPYTELQRLTDLASAVRLGVRRDSDKFRAHRRRIGSLLQSIDLIYTNADFGSHGPEARTREVFENVMYRLEAAKAVLKAMEY